MTSDIKYNWFQIQDMAFTAPHYLKEFLNNVLGDDPVRDFVWINHQSPHLYETRWRPDFVFVYVQEEQIEFLELSLIKNKLGTISLTPRKKFQVFNKKEIDKLQYSTFVPEFIGRKIKFIKGPLEDFYGVIIGFSKESRKYKINIKLLLSDVVFESNTSDFIII